MCRISMSSVYACKLRKHYKKKRTYGHVRPSSFWTSLSFHGHCWRSSPVGLGISTWLTQTANSLFVFQILSVRFFCCFLGVICLSNPAQLVFPSFLCSSCFIHCVLFLFSIFALCSFTFLEFPVFFSVISFLLFSLCFHSFSGDVLHARIFEANILCFC